MICARNIFGTITYYESWVDIAQKIWRQILLLMSSSGDKFFTVFIKNLVFFQKGLKESTIFEAFSKIPA